MQQQKRSKMWRWIAIKAGIDTRLTRDEWMAAYRIGASTRVEKPAWMDTPTYRAMLAELALVAHDFLVAGRRDHAEVAPPPSAMPEPPERAPDPRAAAERQRLFGTQSLPAVNAHGMMRKYNEQHKKDSA